MDIQERKRKLMRAILLTLLACDGVPMPEDSLISAVRLTTREILPTGDHVREALADVKNSRLVSGESDELIGTSWTLTESGKHRARQL